MTKNIKPKILHVTSSLKMGGAEQVLVDIVEQLQGEFEHEVFFFHDGPHRLTLEQLGVRCRHIRGIVSLYDPIFWLRLVRALRSCKPDCIHSLLWGANWASRLVGLFLKIPVVNAVHNCVDGYGRVRRVLDALLLHKVSVYVAVSDNVAASCIRVYPATKNKLVVVDNGIKIPVNHTGFTRAELGIAESAFVIATVGRFEAAKNQELLIKAFALLAREQSNAVLLLLGYGSLEGSLRRLVESLSLQDRVRFIVGQPAHDYYHLFDCFVLTSPSEGLPLALLEAMVRSRCCVLANQDCFHPVLQHGCNGYIAASYDAIRLKEALEKVLKDPAQAQKTGEMAKKTVLDRYTVERMAQQYGKLFHSCIEKTAYGKEPQ